MVGGAPKAANYRFGPFEINAGESSLSRNGTRIKIQDLPYRLLLMLVERPGEIVSREEVRQHLWPENTFVEFDNSLGVAIRKIRDALNDNAEAPRYVETLPRRGYRFVAPVTVLGSQAVQQSAKALSSTPTAEGNAKPAVGHPDRRRYGLAAAALLILVGAVVYGLRSLPRHLTKPADTVGLTPLVQARRAVAVLGFRNLPGRPEDNWLSLAFSEMLNTELAAGGSLRLVSGEDVARAKRELSLSDADSLATGTLERLRTNPGADVVVLGSYTLLPNGGQNRIRLDIRLQDTARGETIAEQAVTGNENDLFELASQAGATLRQTLGVGSISSEASNTARAALPSNEEAARLYAQGRARLWAYDFRGARELLVKAVDADPNYPLAHSALSEALWHLGYEIKARGEAERARDLDAHLPQEQQLLIEGQYRRTISDWPNAIKAYQSLFHLFPDRLDYGLLLASAQTYVKHTDALQTLAFLRGLPKPSNEDPRIDVAEAAAWINLDDNKAMVAAKRAIEKAQAQGSYGIVERSYGFLCQQEVGIGSSQQGLNDCGSAMQSGIAANDLSGKATMGTDLGAIYFQMGDIPHAEQMFRMAIQDFRRIGNAAGAAAALSNLGTSRLSQGDLKAAKTMLERSIVEYQAVEDKDGIALALDNLGDLSRQGGNLEVAATTYQQAKAVAQEIDDKSAIAYVMEGLGDLSLDRGDLGGARKSYEESLAGRKQTGEKQNITETELALARVSLEEGHAAAAETVIRRCKEQFHQDHQADDELSATIAMSDVLLAEGRYDEAAREVDGEKPLMAKSANRLIRLQFDLVSARVEIASGHLESSRAKLDRILREARTHGLLGIELETRLTLALLQSKSRQNSAAQTALLEVENRARSKGFGLVAAKARSVREGGGKKPR